MRKVVNTYAVVPVKGGYAIEYRNGRAKPEYMGDDGLWVRRPELVTAPFQEQGTAEYHVGLLREGDL